LDKVVAVNLLAFNYDPIRGKITIDGHDAKELNVRWLRENIGVVGQEPVLFSMSIRDNIRYGHPRYDGISQEDVELAARQANAHDFIASLPNGYDTLVGERGAHLSGGQKQRIAIARAPLTLSLVYDWKLALASGIFQYPDSSQPRS
jgi:ATP-binding cassette subfamily B (MDR/TAP) protein 1